MSSDGFKLMPLVNVEHASFSPSTRQSHSRVSGRHFLACAHLTLDADKSEVQGLVSTTTLKYDYLVYAVGAETQTFNIPGVKENACFMKELPDAEKVCSSMNSLSVCEC